MLNTANVILITHPQLKLFDLVKLHHIVVNLMQVYDVIFYDFFNTLCGTYMCDN